LDLPSGLNADTGEAQLAVRADATVSFIARKTGLYTGKGPAHSGQRLFSDIGVAADFAEGHASVSLRLWHADLLPKLPVEAYKHQRGHVVVVGGSKGMGGAVVLAAEAALRSGAGMVTVATVPENLAGLLARLPEAMWVDPLSSDQDQNFASVLSRASVVVLGPGLGRSSWAEQVLDAVSAFQGPIVIDADGLYWLAERYNATCLLKGPGTVMGDQRSQAICGHGNPGMATAGMGDVLAGLAGSLIAQQPDDMAGAFCAAVLLHSAAGDLAAQEIGERGITATAVIPRVAALLQELPTLTG
jgi:NAD(P)H-hydrate epimerase